MVTIRTLMKSNYLLKSCAFIVGFGLWYFFSNSHQITVSKTIPLTFYGTQIQQCVCETFQDVDVCLKGFKADFYALDLRNLALFINSDNLKIGKNTIYITRENLFLPPEIKLLHCTPSHIVVTLNNIQ